MNSVSFPAHTAAFILYLLLPGPGVRYMISRLFLLEVNAKQCLLPQEKLGKNRVQSEVS